MKLNYRIFSLIILLILLSLSGVLQAQKDDEPKKKKKTIEANAAVIIAPVYTAQIPFGNMRDRFGYNSLFGFHLAYKTNKNWMIGGEANFLFGTNVKENYVLNNISLPFTANLKWSILIVLACYGYSAAMFFLLFTFILRGQRQAQQVLK